MRVTRDPHRKLSRRLWAAAALVAACTPAAAPGTGTTPDPAAAPPAATPAPTPAPPPSAAPLRLAPQRARFLAHQLVVIENDYEGLPPRTDLGFRIWFAVTVGATPDSQGRLPAMFVIDSVVADSGVELGPLINLYSARGLTVTGRLRHTGALEHAVYSDSGVVLSLSRVLGFFQRFFPNLPPEGVRPGQQWIDTVLTDEPTSTASLSRKSVVDARAGGWGTLEGAAALHLEARETYEFSGKSSSTGQPLEYSGTGVREADDYLGPDGRYLGGQARDSASVTILLPAQGIKIPQRQHSTLVVTVIAQ